MTEQTPMRPKDSSLLADLEPGRVKGVPKLYHAAQRGVERGERGRSRIEDGGLRMDGSDLLAILYPRSSILDFVRRSSILNHFP